jgi:general secretion pathway protein G
MIEEKYMHRRSIRAEQAFTLIELLIVVAIIAIISGIAVPALMKAFYQAKDKKTMADMRNFAVAIAIYRLDTERVPQTNNINTLIQTLSAYQGKDGENLQLNLRDSWGHAFYYAYDTVDRERYTLKSFGRDGAPGATATTVAFNPDADTVIVTGIFTASHEGVMAIVGN